MPKSIEPNKKTFITIVAILAIFASGYFTGRNGFIFSPNLSGNSAVINQEKGKPSNVDFGLFWDAWRLVENQHVTKPDDKERLYGSIAGMVASLDDPFSVFMKPTENSRFNEDISGNFEGIGAELVQKEGLITVVAPLDNSPAQKAGLRPEDVITEIDGQATPDSIEEAVKKIRGKKGTQVTLTVIRDNSPVKITITRDTVEVKSVTYKKQNAYGIVKINQFNANMTEQLDDALAAAKRDNVKGMVVDLRNNPGGLLDKAIETTSRFIDDGVVLVERDRDKKETELRTIAVKEKVTIPVVVLVNKGSASASEIFAGALQDAGKAKIIGETTFGKGSVQTIEPLKDGSAIRITIAEWLTPKKREINKVGIKPDVEVKRSEDDIKTDRDPQLDKAIETLQGR